MHEVRLSPLMQVYLQFITPLVIFLARPRAGLFLFNGKRASLKLKLDG
jgi:hypothetical protein